MIIYTLIITSILTGQQFDVGKYPSLVMCEKAKYQWFLEADKQTATGECVETER